MTLEEAAILAIAKIVEAVANAKAGKTDPTQVLAHLATLHDYLASNDAAIDAALAAKKG